MQGELSAPAVMAVPALEDPYGAVWSRTPRVVVFRWVMEAWSPSPWIWRGASKMDSSR